MNNIIKVYDNKANIIVDPIDTFNCWAKNNIKEKMINIIIWTLQRAINFPSPSTILHNERCNCMTDENRMAK